MEKKNVSFLSPKQRQLLSMCEERGRLTWQDISLVYSMMGARQKAMDQLIGLGFLVFDRNGVYKLKR